MDKTKGGQEDFESQVIIDLLGKALARIEDLSEQVAELNDQVAGLQEDLQDGFDLMEEKLDNVSTPGVGYSVEEG